MYLVAVNENRPEEICAVMREAGLQAKVGRMGGGRNGRVGLVRVDGRGMRIICVMIILFGFITRETK